MNQIFILGAMFVLLSTSTSGCIQNYLKSKQTKPATEQGTTVTTTTPEENGTAIPAITQQELDNGYYYGTEEQKKPGTPEDWIYVEAGRSSMWKAPTK